MIAGAARDGRPIGQHREPERLGAEGTPKGWNPVLGSLRSAGLEDKPEK